METERTDGIVLRLYPVTESSLIVTWYTREFGKLRTLAKGARRPKSPFRGRLDLFYEDELLFLRSRRSGLHLLHEAHLLSPQAGLRGTVAKLAAASYAVELVDALTEFEDPSGEVYSLLGNVLSMLEKSPGLVPLIWFELKLLAAVGWKPSFEGGGGTDRILRRLGESSAIGVQRVRLTGEQVAAAWQRVTRFRAAELGRALRSQGLVWAELKH